MPKNPFSLAADLLDPPEDTWEPLPHQIPPAGNWFVWMLLGGRGAGKTATCARQMHEHVHGPPCLRGVPGGHWPAIIAPTLGDGVTSCVNGPSGLKLHEPGVKVTQSAGGTLVKWPNGTEAKIFGAHTPEDVERLRSGGNRCFVWAEELAAWRHMEECWQHMRYGLRVGPRPHVVVSTTPKPRVLIKKLIKQSTEEPGEVVITKATTDDNPHLPKHIRKALFEDYGGTRLGRQELYAEVLEDIENALWTPDVIERSRIKFDETPEDYARVVIGVDPAATEGGDETGIIAAGMTLPYAYYAPDREWADVTHGFLLGDYSMHGTPKAWARTVIDAYHAHQANAIIVEINNGGEMVAHTLRTEEPALRIITVHASRGKSKRAEPVSSLYEQGRVHHVGEFQELEDQMVNWDPVDPDDGWSPDRMDAMVWAFTDLLVNKRYVNRSKVQDNRLVGRR